MNRDLINHIKYTRPLIIAGPCSVESKEQFFSTVEEIQKIPQVNVIRAGIWKPRTKPGCFEGLGVEALHWVKEIKTKCCLPIIIEVANEEQLAAALEHEVDGFWIGTRTSVNPFALDSIFSAIAQHNRQIPVFIKNPLAPDLNLWIGAVLRAKKFGLENLAMIHRGFASYPVHSSLRSEPYWRLALEMRKEYPEIPMLLDPSHIAGKREYVLSLILLAKYYQFDGIIVESHINPEFALTDKEQQLNPVELGRALAKYFQGENRDQDISLLKSHRSSIDILDKRLLQVLAERFWHVDNIAIIKHRLGKTICQENRYAQISKNWQNSDEVSELKEEFLQSLLELIHSESLGRQKDKIARYLFNKRAK